MLAGRRAGRDHRGPERARVEPHLDLDSRVPPRVEHLAAVDVDDLAHPGLPLTVRTLDSVLRRERCLCPLVPALLRIEVELGPGLPYLGGKPFGELYSADEPRRRRA